MKQLPFLSLLLLSLMMTSCKSKGAEESAQTGTTSGSPVTGIAYQIDVPRTQLKWNAYKPTGEHHGVIPVTGGTIYVDSGMITGGVVDMNMSGLEVRDMDGEMKEKIESHLRGTAPGKEDDFFNVGKFPTAAYKITSSTKLENDPLGTHMINGELTIRGITKPVSFKAIIDLSSGVALKATAEPFMINRTEWDIKYMSKKFFDDLKDDFVNDEVRLELTVGAVQKGK